MTTNIKSEVQQKMSELYKEKMFLADKKYVEHCIALSELILNDTVIQKASTPFLKEFKQNITDFLNIYPKYKNYSLYNDLLITYHDLTLQYYNAEKTNDNSEFDYIVNLLMRYGFDDINDKYEFELEKFIRGSQIPLFEDFAKKLPRKQINLRRNLMLWLQQISKCQNYSCYITNFQELYEILKIPRENFFKVIYEKFDKINIQYANESYEIIKNILNDTLLQHLDINLKQNLTKQCEQFLRIFKHNTLDSNHTEILH